MYLLNAVLNCGHIVQRMYILVLFSCIIIILTLCWELRGQPSVHVFVVDFFFFLHPVTKPKTAKFFADRQSDASEVAQIYVISFQSRVYVSRQSLTFSIAASSVRNSSQSVFAVPCCFRTVRVQQSLQWAICWCGVQWQQGETEDWHPTFWNLFIVYYHLVWGLDFLPITEQFDSQYPHPLSPYAKHFVIFFLAGLFWVWLFVVEMKNLKNNAYSIQKLWMGEWRCQLYVHYMFWCNQKHWEYVVLCCKNKNPYLI